MKKTPIKQKDKLTFTGAWKTIDGSNYGGVKIQTIDTNFTKVALGYLLAMYNHQPAQSTKVINFLLENSKRYNNLIPATVDKIEHLTGVSKKTVINTLKALESMGCITRQIGHIFINPDILWSGSAVVRNEQNKEYAHAAKDRETADSRPIKGILLTIGEHDDAEG